MVGLVKFIPLSKDSFVLVDAEDYDRLAKQRWYLSPCGTQKYAKCKSGHMHRIIMDNPKGMEIDHINRDSLDCRKENLRVCTRSQNTFNHPRRKTNTSGHVGVWLRKDTGKWAVEIMVNYKKKCLGNYASKEEAVKVRLAAEQTYYPGFKRTG